ncbi:MAG: hypothetical protein K2K72_01045 [Duncaniella sp.]|nr:hypothetical protein [Duncaniella sp.]
MKFDGNEVVVSLDEINAEILKGLAFTPSSLRVEGLQNVTSGYTANAETIFFTSTGYLSVSYKPTAATPVGSLNAYVKTTGDEIELPEGEEITLKLDTDAGTTHEIYFRWTPKESPVTFSSRAAEADSDDFIKHTDAITVAGPGTLEYYTRLSNTTSEVKSIRVVAKQPEEEEPGISTGVDKIDPDTPDEGSETYYRIDGSRAADLTSPGIYICRGTSGATRKILVK